MSPRKKNEGREYFAMWLDRTMAQRDLTGGSIARALNVKDSAVSRWRNGKGLPSTDNIQQLALLLRVDPIRLAVTAGLLKSEVVKSEPLPLPEDSARRGRVREKLNGIRELTLEEREAILEAYDAAPS